MAQTVRDEVTRRATELLERRFRPSAEQQRRARASGFNYATDVYRTPSGRPEEEFVVRTTRLMHLELGRFELAYLRRNDRWQPVYSGLTVNECFAIDRDELFWPLT